MNLNGFLQYHNIDIESLCIAIVNQIDLRPAELLYLSGSVIDGIGNTASDIDAFLITDRSLGQLTFDKTLIIPVTTFAVDLEVYERRHLDALLELLASFPANEERDPRRSLCFSLNDLVFLHRLANGIPVVEQDQFHEVQSKLNRRAISRVIFDQAAAIIPAQACDIAGLIEAGDFDSAALSAQRLLGYAIDAALAVQGNSNLAQKWRLCILRQSMEKRWHHPLPAVLSGMSSYEAWRDLFLLQGFAQSDFKNYAHQCVRLGRHIIPWGQQIFIGTPQTDDEDSATLGGSDAIPDTFSNSPGGEPFVDNASIVDEYLPQLRADVVIRWQDGRITLDGTKNSLGLGITELTLDALFYFDGITTVNEAIAQLAKLADVETQLLAQMIHDLSIVLAYYGFLEQGGSLPDRDSHVFL